MTWQRTARRSAIWGVLLSLSSSLWAQNDDPILPKGITPWEMQQWLSSPESQLPLGQSRGIPTPPQGNNIRTAAEWEEIEVLTITWRSFPCILKQITAAAVEECRVVIFGILMRRVGQPRQRGGRERRVQQHLDSRLRRQHGLH